MKKDWYFFIKKTRVAVVLSLLIVVLGYLSMKSLPQEIYPDTSTPRVYISAGYTGASASVMETSVANVIESAMTGIEYIKYITSVCGDGYYSAELFFNTGSDKDVNLLNVKNQLQEISFQLPPEVQRDGVNAVTTSGDKGAIILNLAAINDNWEQLDLANYAKSNIVDKLKMVNGVSDVVLSGSGDYSMRIWLNPQKMAALGITTSDIEYALSEQNRQFVVGTLGAPPLKIPQNIQMIVKADNLLSSAEAFEKVVIKSNTASGQIYLSDVAQIELGSGDYGSFAMVGDKTTALIQIIPAAGVNMVELSNALQKKVTQISHWLPKELNLSIIYDSSIYMKESINEVVSTIFITVAIVILVILLFLGNGASALIPCVTIPVSLIGAFCILYLFKMSINMFTLFALILAVSVVVDDAIVVVENVNRFIKEGCTPKRATQLTMEEVGVTLVTMSLILMTVFFPICFIAGFTGILYKQFAVFLSASILLSAVCALTLSPAMASVMLVKDSDFELFAQGKKGLLSKLYFLFNNLFNKLGELYTECVRVFVYSSKVTILTYLFVIFLMVTIYKLLPKSFIPNEDQGIVYVQAYIMENASVEKSKELTKLIVNRIQEVEGVDPKKLLVMGGKGSSTIYVQLKDWQERNLSIPQKIVRKINKQPTSLSNVAIQTEINKKLKDINDARIQVYSPQAMSQGSSGLEFNLIGSDMYTIEEISDYADKIADELSENKNFDYIYNTYTGTYPMYIMHIDYKKIMALNISVQELTSTLSTYIGSSPVSSFTRNGKNYQVIMQAEDNFRRNKEDLNKVYVRSMNGTMVPVTAVIDLEEVNSTAEISRFNQNRSVKLMGQNSESISLGQAIDIIEDCANRILPKGISYEWSGDSLIALESSRQTAGIIALSLLFIYFFLVALYNSWSIPIVVLIVSPVSIVGAMIFQLMLGLPFNIYSQVGIITLIGLAAKQSILFVEFAMSQKEAGGLSIQNAAIIAAKMRFRAILMTELSFLIGVLPMLFAAGPSANSRISLASAVFGGMVTTVSLGAILTPGFYAMIQAFVDKVYKKNIEEEYYDEKDEGAKNNANSYL